MNRKIKLKHVLSKVLNTGIPIYNTRLCPVCDKYFFVDFPNKENFTFIF